MRGSDEESSAELRPTVLLTDEQFDELEPVLNESRPIWTVFAAEGFDVFHASSRAEAVGTAERRIRELFGDTKITWHEVTEGENLVLVSVAAGQYTNVDISRRLPHWYGGGGDDVG